MAASKHGREVHYRLEVGNLASALKEVANALETCWQEATRQRKLDTRVTESIR
ncbi:MAG: hypothetical protein VYE73_03935 [Acidobacteriota bacterium]|nr:hypothetical protein [Acidobacteriota bacterium]